MFSPNAQSQENNIIPSRSLKKPNKAHYTAEVMLNILIIYNKLPDGRFPITIYIYNFI